MAPDETIASHRLSQPVFPTTSDGDKKTLKRKKVNQLLKTMVGSVCLGGGKEVLSVQNFCAMKMKYFRDE